MNLDELKMPKFDLYKKAIDKIETQQRTFDPYWGLPTLEETERAYYKIEQAINSDFDLSEDSKKKLIDLVIEKRKKIPEIDAEVQKKLKEEDELMATAIKNAKDRYAKLNFLKKLKLHLLKQNPKNVNFDFLGIDTIDSLYSKKR